MVLNKMVLCLVGLSMCTAAAHATVLTTLDPFIGAFTVGSTIQITWDDDLQAENSELVLWDGERKVVRVIVDAVSPAGGVTHWQIPHDVLPGSFYRIGIRDKHNPDRVDYSSGFLTLGRSHQLVSSVQEIDNATDVSCIPFPADNLVEVRWSPERVVQSIELVDVHYNVILTQQVDVRTNHQKLNVATLPSGMCFVKVIGPQGQVGMHPLMIVH